jgi:protein ImuB
VAEHDPVADRLALEELAGWCGRFSPSVSLEDVAEPAALQLEVGGVARHFGGEAALAELVQSEFAARGWQTRLGLADTWGGAWAAAGGSAVRTMARGPTTPATSAVAMDGLGAAARDLWVRTADPPVAIVPAGAGLNAYAALPLEVLRLPAALLELLAELGLARIGQLLLLPRADLAARFGPLLAQRLDQLSGAAAELLPSHSPPEEDRAELLFEAPTEKLEAVAAAFERLLAELAPRLAARRQGALELCCRLTGPGGLATELHVRCFRPNSQAAHWCELLRLSLERRTLPGPVEKVEVLVTSAGPLEFWQQNLFGAERGRAERQVGLLIDRLAGRLGRDAVLSPRLAPEPQPELVCHLEPLVGRERLGAVAVNRRVRHADHPESRRARAANRARGARAAEPVRTADPTGEPASGVVGTADPARFRPLRLWSPPEPITVVALAPEGAPARFRWRGSEHRVGRAWGPERIETSWWRGRYVRRDYYRVETHRGERYWLFRRRSDGRWFLHGAFE